MRNAQRVVKPGDKATGSQQTSTVAKKHEEKSSNCLYTRGWSKPANKECTKQQSPQPNTQHTIDNAARKQAARTNQYTNQNPTTHIGDCVAASHLKSRQLKPGLQNK